MRKPKTKLQLLLEYEFDRLARESVEGRGIRDEPSI